MTEVVDPSLTAPLAAAVEELEAWMQAELLADQARSTPNSPLYQYTEASGDRASANARLTAPSGSTEGLIALFSDGAPIALLAEPARSSAVSR